MFVGLIVAIVLLVGRGGGGSPVLAMVPADVDAFGMVRFGTLIRTPSGQKLRKMALDFQKDDNIAKEIDNYQDMVMFDSQRPWPSGHHVDHAAGGSGGIGEASRQHA